jgi:tetratricopeptide (TPR) repeat protein
VGPAPGPALIGKAVALQLLHRFDEAGRAYEEVLASDPNSEEALSNFIAMSIATHDLERVRDHSVQLLKIRTHSTVALQGLATVAFDRSDHQAAAVYCNRILELAPESLEGWHNFRIAMDQYSFSSAEPDFAWH